jgi:hypothetical protein
MNTKPFPVDTATNPIVTAARETLRTRYRASVAARKTDFESRAEQAWQRYEESRREKFLSDYREGHWVRPENPYGSLGDAESVRVAAEQSDRIKTLGECYTATKDLQFPVESLKVFLYRTKSKSKLSDVLEFLSEWIPTVGDEEIYTDIQSTHFISSGPVGYGMKNVPARERRVIASGLSPEVVRVLQGFKIKSGTVYFVTGVEFEDRPGQPVERWTYATQDEDLDSSEY